jgi:hypothetical protein
MAVTLGSTGITFPDATTQTTAAVSGAPTYRNVTTTTTDITLTASDGGAYLTVTSTASVNINLPAANLLTGSRTITIKNIGTFAMLVYDNAGNYLFPLVAGQGVICWASVASTAAGTWTIKDFPQDYIGASVTLNNINSQYGFTRNICSPLTTTTQVTVYTSNGSLYGLITTNTSGVLSFSTPQVLYSPNSTYGGNIVDYVGVAALSSTSGIAWYRTNSPISNSLWAIAFTLSGSTFTMGTPVAVETSTSVNLGTGYQNTANIKMLSSTTAVIQYMTASTTLTIKAMTLSGTTITVGSAATTTGVQPEENDICGVSSTVFCSIYSLSSGGTVQAKAGSVSGTTITLGSQTTINPDTSYTSQGSICAVSTTRCVVQYVSPTNGQNYLRSFGISGTTISNDGSETALSVTAYTNRMVATSSSAGVASYVAGDQAIRAIGWTLSGATVNIGTVTTLSSGVSSGTYTYHFGSYPFQTAGVTPSASFVNFSAWENSTIYQQPLGASGSTLTNTYNAQPAITGTAGTNSNNGVPTQLMAALSSTRSIIIVREPGNNGLFNVTAYLVDYSTNVPTYQTKIVVGVCLATTSGAFGMAITTLTSTTAVVTYVSGTTTLVGNVITMSGSSLSVGAQATINAATTVRQNSVSAISSTTLVAYYNKTSSVQVANVLTVSGTSISVGAEATVVSTSAFDVNVLGLSSTIAIANASDRTQFYVLTISGTSITASAVQNLGSFAGNRPLMFTAINSTTILATTSSISSPFQSTALIFNISGGLVSTVYPTAVIPTINQTYVWPEMMTANRGYMLSGDGSWVIPFEIQNNLVIFGDQQSVQVYGGAAPLGTFVIGAPVNAAKLACAFQGASSGNFTSNQVFTLGAAN